MLMAHRRAKRKLHINRDCYCNRSCCDRRKFSRIDNDMGKRAPEFRSNESDHDDQSKKRLRKAGMKDSDLVFKHGDTKSAEHALQNHRAEGNRSEVANPSPRFAAPKPDREDDRQKAYRRSNQAVRVLKKNPTDPFRNRKQK